jgi:4-alpha-glucanotransferase
MFARGSGIILHPTSLPGPFGIGDLGPSAHRWLDWLADAGQNIWQVLPLGPTGYGDSPYQCFSAFAGNPVLISPEKLVEDGLLDPSDLASPPLFPQHAVAFEDVNRYKFALLHRAFERFQSLTLPSREETVAPPPMGPLKPAGGPLKPAVGLSGDVPAPNEAPVAPPFRPLLAKGGTEESASSIPDSFHAFKESNSAWLDDYALFMALKQAHGDVVWTQWPRDIALREPAALASWRQLLAVQIEERKFWQFLFFRQWTALQCHAHQRNIRIMGDLPIYVAHDSADVWSHPSLFCLTPDGEPEKIAGVPPDYFSATGQLWGNPIYRWDEHARTGFAWWIERFRATLQLIDIGRLDHFRGFAAYWEVPAGETTAINGQWIKGPGEALFAAVEAQLGKLPIVAENLGVITEDVQALRNQFGYPGMAILQFAFGKDPMAPSFKPHNYVHNLVAYTGTHDNDTVVGWWTQGDQGDHSRTTEDIRREREFTRRYLNLGPPSGSSQTSVPRSAQMLHGAETPLIAPSGEPSTRARPINWVFICTVMASVADLALFPLQDVIGLGSEARMNRPGTASGNWAWRFLWEMLSTEAQSRLKEYAALYDRQSHSA